MPISIAALAAVNYRGVKTGNRVNIVLTIAKITGLAALPVLTGVITAVPLLFFGAAASRVPLSTLGPLQYLAPTVQFLIGVLVFDEHLGTVKLLGFVLVWCALVVFTADLVTETRRVRVRLPVAEPV